MIELKDAIFQMKPGDKFNWQDRLDNCLEMNKSLIIVTCDGDRYPMSASNMKLKGEIIRAEPEVLTAEDMLMKYIPNMSDDITHNIVTSYGNAMHQNGELSMWLKIKNDYERMTIDEGYFKNFSMSQVIKNNDPTKEPKQ